MTCSLCSREDRRLPVVKRRCGFEGIHPPGAAVFTSDNNQCLTLNALQYQAEIHGRFHNGLECGRIWVLPYPQAGGWIILTAQQKRDRVDTAIYLEGGTAYALPLSIAEKAIEYYRALKAAGDCEVLP